MFLLSVEKLCSMRWQGTVKEQGHLGLFVVSKEAADSGENRQMVPAGGSSTAEWYTVSIYHFFYVQRRNYESTKVLEIVRSDKDRAYMMTVTQ